MRLGVLREPEGEMRVALVPNSILKLSKSGFEVFIEKDAGVNANPVSYTHLTLPTNACV